MIRDTRVVMRYPLPDTLDAQKRMRGVRLDE
jgi:hypothetical protein